MADNTITVQGVVLRDNWPGVPIDPPVDSSDMSAASVGHNLANPMWRLGQKWKVYNTDDSVNGTTGFNVGWSTFIYLEGAADIATAPAATATSIVCIDNTIAAANAADKYFIVTGATAVTTHETAGLIGVALSTMTNSYFGWYWCGGVCPIGYVPLFTTASTLVTDDSVVAGCELASLASAALTVALSANGINSQVAGVGYALYADGA